MTSIPNLLASVLLLVASVPAVVEAANVASAPPQPASTASGNSAVPIFSGDGRYVVFLSEARNLATNDGRAGLLNVYLHDRLTANVTLISVNGTGTGSGNEGSSSAAIDATGSFVAFQSESSDLAPDDANNASDIFLRDALNGTTRLISRSINGVGSANGASAAPVISSDERVVVFESTASDLVPGDTNGVADLFAYEVASGGVVLVSADAFGAGAAEGASESASISADGRFVVFVKRATNEVTGGTSVAEIYLRDLELGATAWVSSSAGSVLTAVTNRYRCSDAVISANGGVVAFMAGAPSATSGHLFRYDRATALADVIATNVQIGFHPALSADGRYLAFTSGGELFVYDHESGSNHLASACAPEGMVLEKCHAPASSADGKRVAFIATHAGKASVFAYDRIADCVQLVSVTTNGAAASAVPSASPVISADGRFVAYESLDSGIVSEDYNLSVDVFVRDLQEGTTELISCRAGSLPASSAARLSRLTPGSVSADGNVVAFTSWGGEVAGDEASLGMGLYVRNLSQSVTTKVPMDGTRYMAFPVLSASGRYVAYKHNVTNFYWADLESGITKRVGSYGNQYNNYYFLSDAMPVISPDGRYVAHTGGLGDLNGFASRAVYITDMWDPEPISIPLFPPDSSSQDIFPVAFTPDGKWLAFIDEPLLIPFQTFGDSTLYIRHVETGERRTVEEFVLRGTGPVSSYLTNAVSSADSRFLYYHLTKDRTNRIVNRYDIQTPGTNTVICEQCMNPSPSADGRLVAVQTSRPPGNLLSSDVFVLDTLTGASNLVSVAMSGDGGGNKDSFTPLISHDSRYVVFSSRASNLVPNDNNNATDIFVRDLHANTTMLVSRNVAGTGSGDGESSGVVLSADGRTVFFQSFAGDLAPGDYNRTRDVFSLSLAGPDTDRDGLDDDWEMAYFDTLSRDGSEDFDNDGQSDAEEFRAGTDPTNLNSILRVLTVRPVMTPLGVVPGTPGASGGTTTTVMWNASPGRTYRIQFKAGLEHAGWTDVPGDVLAAGTTASAVHSMPEHPEHVFYRVQLVR